MLKNIIIFTLFFTLIGCVNLKDEVLIDKVLFVKFGTVTVDGKEYQHMTKGGIGFNPWKQMPTIKYDAAALNGEFKSLIAFILINEKGDIDGVKIYRSSGLPELDKEAIAQIKKTAKAKKWIVQDKPVNFAVAQQFIISPF